MVRVLIIPDTHCIFTNPNNRLDMIAETLDLFRNIRDKVIPEVKPDVIIQLGDLFDRGFEKLPTTHWSILVSIMKDIKEAVKHHLYLLLGNHEYTYSRNNPTFLITKISDTKMKELYTTKDMPERTDDIWIAPSHLDFGNVIVNFMHWTPDKNYRLPKQPGKKVIALYHDDLITFESKEKLYHHSIGKGIDIVRTDIYDNVNLAIHGHIHTPLQDFRLSNRLQTEIVTPGSALNRTVAEQHEEVLFPILDINSEGYKRSHYVYKLPPKEDIFIETVVESNKKMYELTKMIKKTKNKANSSQYFDEMIASLNNPTIESIIREALDIQPTDALKKAEIFKEEELKGTYN